MSGGGGAARGGWAWWPPSRRRQQQQQTGAALERGRDWALLAAALLLLLWLLPAGSALGLSAVALAWAVWVGGTGRSSQQPQPPPHLRRTAPPPHSFSGRPPGTGAVANGGLVAMAALREKSSGRPRVLLGGSPVGPPAAHFMLPPRRRYPIHQAQYASLGTLPSICWDGYRRKNRLSTCYSSPVQSPVTVKIARPDSSIGHSPLLEQPFSPGVFSPAPNSTPDPCAKEVVLNALKESRKRAMMEEEEEDETYPQGLPGGQESKRRRHGSGGSGQSVLEPLVANGGLASLVPKPGSLKRVLLSHCLDDSSSKRSRTSSLSSANSLCVGGDLQLHPQCYRQFLQLLTRKPLSGMLLGALDQLWKRSGQSTSPLSSPASSRSQTPERPSKKTRSLDASLTEEEAQQASGTSTPVKADKEVQAEKAAETPVTRHGSLGRPSSPGSRRKRKRRIQLLPTGRVDRFFTLPPPPELGYSATSEDLDADKKATLQRFNKVLEEEADSTPDLPVETTTGPNALTFSLPAAKILPMPSAGTAAAGSNPLLESLKKMQGEQSCPVQAAATTETPQPRTPAVTLDLSSSVPVTTPEAKPLALSLPVSLAAAPSEPEKEPASSVTTTSSSELGQIPARPLSAPRSSVLGLLASPPVSQPSPAVTAASSGSSTAPVFKPLFGSLAKSDGPTFSSSSAPEAPASTPAPPPAAVPTLGPPCGASGSTFKPIFGEPLTPASSALPSAEATTASLFTFKQSPQLALAHRTPSSCPGSGTSGFPGLLEAASAPPASSSAPASTMPASASKSAFSFGLSVPAAPSSTTTASAAVTSATTSTSTAQPFLFGSLPTTTAAGTPTVAPVFHFGKAAAATKPALNPGASLAFNQVPPSSTAGPAPTTATAAAAPFSIFGSGAQTPSAPPVATQQPAPLTFGSCSPAFSTAFGTPPKPPPSYRASTSQLTLDAGAPEGQQAASKPGPLNFGAHLSFTGSGAQPAAQTAFGSSTTQTAPFGGSGPLAPFGTKSSASQPLAFGATTSVFSFGTATTTAASAPSFGATTQTTSSGTGGSLFGGSAPSSFTTFGAPGQPAAAAGNTFGLGAAAGGSGGTGSSTGGFSFGSGQGGAAGAAPPFGSSLAQQPSLGSQNQGTPFAFSVPGTTPEGKPAFGGSTTPTFSIGAGSKMGSRQRLQARRHNTRKK
ncbi:hypothetical protein lerEdw1_004853 [Lerista edwardsae]|nr:hypothetical protein lerEdw1_004853 [Lerista edwardsae]